MHTLSLHLCENCKPQPQIFILFVHWPIYFSHIIRCSVLIFSLIHSQKKKSQYISYFEVSFFSFFFFSSPPIFFNPQTANHTRWLPPFSVLLLYVFATISMFCDCVISTCRYFARTLNFACSFAFLGGRD